jgi:hypothetical protein
MLKLLSFALLFLTASGIVAARAQAMEPDTPDASSRAKATQKLFDLDG